MKIAAAQLQTQAGNITANLNKHLELIELAASQQVDLMVFPELSLTGYEPEIAAELAVDHAQAQEQLVELKKAAEVHQIKICAGMPTRGKHKPRISALIFSPKQTLQIYSKQILHADEYPFFEAGNQAGVITCKGKRIALAICYESLQEKHLKQSLALNIDVYLASVAKDEQSVAKALPYFAHLAHEYKLAVAMANNTGACDNFVGFGCSTAWNASGEVIHQLNDRENGLAIIELD